MEKLKTHFVISGNDGEETETKDRSLALSSVEQGFVVREIKEINIYTEDSVVYVRTISDLKK